MAAPRTAGQRPKTLRAALLDWQPILAHNYGLMPWHLGDGPELLSYREVESFMAHAHRNGLTGGEQ